MTEDQKEKQSRPENESKSGTGQPSPSTPGVKEEGTRLGTKTDIRGTGTEKSEGESPAKDNLRDGT